MLTETAIEYLETVYNVTVEGDSVVNARLAEKFGVSPPSVTEMIHRLERDGYVTFDRAVGLQLTAEGIAVAENSLRRHRLAERFLQQVLDMDWIQAHEEAQSLQKALTPAIEAHIVQLLRNPTTCPHGNPIPGTGPSPQDYLRSHDAVRLSAAPFGAPVRVLCVSEVVEDESALLRMVGEYGLRPGADLARRELDGDGESLVRLEVDSRWVDLARAVAEKIWVYQPDSNSKNLARPEAVGADGGI